MIRRNIIRVDHRRIERHHTSSRGIIGGRHRGKIGESTEGARKATRSDAVKGKLWSR